MGLTRDALAFLLATRRAGVDFSATLTLGRQGIWADDRVVSAAFADVGERIEPAEARRIFEAEGGYGEPFFRRLGASTVDSLDASTWEGSSLVHDLNQPIPDELRGRYSAVVDGGTLEHVFNLPMALRNALELVRAGGHYLGFSPANNWFGHGFYQLNAELYFRALAPENGYRLRCILLQRADRPQRWYQVLEPPLTHLPVLLLGRLPVDLYVLAERTEEREVFASFPAQRGYSVAWQGSAPDRSLPTLRRRLARLEPLPLKTLRLILAPTLFNRRKVLRPVRLTEIGGSATSPPPRRRATR